MAREVLTRATELQDAPLQLHDDLACFDNPCRIHRSVDDMDGDGDGRFLGFATVPTPVCDVKLQDLLKISVGSQGRVEGLTS
jgi:hypothetical protein